MRYVWIALLLGGCVTATPESRRVMACTYVYPIGPMCSEELHTPVGPGPRGTFDAPTR